MKIIKSIVLLFFGMLLVSCNDDVKQKVFDKNVYVSLINKGTSEILEGEPTEINYQVVLSKSFDKEISLVFELENLELYPNLVTYSKNVVIKKNLTLGTFKITGVSKSDAQNILSENKKFNLKLKSVSGVSEKVVLDQKNYSVTVKKDDVFGFLSKKQKELLEHWKSKGIDVTRWIGKIKVHTKITTGGGGNFSPFDKSQVRNYKGITHITISEKATKEKPLLKMDKNAFGLNEYLQWIFRSETILNTGFWYNPDTTNPNYKNMPVSQKAVVKALGKEKYKKWKNKEYPFNVFVDAILVKKNGVIEFVRENGAFDTYTNFLTFNSKRNIAAVDFQYEFPLWEDLVKLASNNDKLVEDIIQGGSIHPNNYIGHSTIITDDWSGGNWIKPEGKYQDNVMSFNFNSDHTSSGSYDEIQVIFKLD